MIAFLPPPLPSLTSSILLHFATLERQIGKCSPLCHRCVFFFLFFYARIGSHLISLISYWFWQVDRRIGRILGDSPHMEHAGSDVALTISSGCLRISTLEGSTVVACHDMPNISFASGGDPVRAFRQFICLFLFFPLLLLLSACGWCVCVRACADIIITKCSFETNIDLKTGYTGLCSLRGKGQCAWSRLLRPGVRWRTGAGCHHDRRPGLRTPLQRVSEKDSTTWSNCCRHCRDGYGRKVHNMPLQIFVN